MIGCRSPEMNRAQYPVVIKNVRLPVSGVGCRRSSMRPDSQCPSRLVSKTGELVMRDLVHRRPRSYGSYASSVERHDGRQAATRDPGVNTTSASLRGYPLETRQKLVAISRSGRANWHCGNRAVCPPGHGLEAHRMHGCYRAPAPVSFGQGAGTIPVPGCCRRSWKHMNSPASGTAVADG